MRIYLTTQPIRISSTGTIPLAVHIDEFFSTCKYTPLCKHEDGYTEFGYLDGTGSELSNALRFCGRGFNTKRMFESEFVGALALYYTPITDPMTEEVTKTLKQLLDDHAVTYITDSNGDVDVVYHAKAYKLFEFKTICKNQFEDYNDLIANISKEILLMTEYKDGLSADQQTRLSTVITNMKNIYDAETCLSALEADVAKVVSILPVYYAVKTAVDGATTIEDVKAVTYK